MIDRDPTAMFLRFNPELAPIVNLLLVQPVDAWRMVSMLPFYALSGEHDGDSDPTNDKHFDT